MLERIYEESEQVNIHFLGYVSEHSRYDFAIVFTKHFFGKPLVICMQTKRSALLSYEDLHGGELLQKEFAITDPLEAEQLAHFLQKRIPSVPMNEQ